MGKAMLQDTRTRWQGGAGIYTQGNKTQEKQQLRQENGTKKGSKTNYNTTEDKIFKTKQ